MNLEQAVIQVAQGLYHAVQPGLGAREARAIVGQAQSGDHTYALDETAEEALERLVRSAGDTFGIRLAYYSEDRGLVRVHEGATHVLVVDPIDGTRPAVCGFESCCVSVAAAPLAVRVPLGSVEAACLVELGTGRLLAATKSSGVYIHRDGAATRLSGLLSARATLDGMFWAYEVCGRSSKATQQVLGPLIDQSSHAGGCFVFNSSSYAISRILTGQLDAYVDFYAALLQGAQGEHWRAESRSLFSGRLFGLFPYDIAAAAFLAREAGAFVSDALGRDVSGVNLLDSTEHGMLSMVVAANPQIGEAIVQNIQSQL